MTSSPREMKLHSASMKPTTGKGRKLLLKHKTNKHKPERKSTDDVKSLCKLVALAMIRKESKEPIPQFRGTGAPTILSNPHPGYELVETEESALLRNNLGKLFGDKHYKFRLSTALNMSSSGAGAVNSTIANTTLATVADFILLASVFNEYFIHEMVAVYQPVSRYNYPLTGVTATSVANLPLGCGSLQHAQVAYSSMAGMSDNFHYQHHSTGDPFTYVWKNTESVDSTVVSQIGSFTQSWSDTSNASNYTGTIQFLSQSAPPALPASQVLGTFFTYWIVSFRARL